MYITLAYLTETELSSSSLFLYPKYTATSSAPSALSLARESLLVQNNSLEVLAEFEKLEDWSVE